METVRVIIATKPTAGGPESPDVEGWSAAGGSYAGVAKLAQDGMLCP